MQHDGLQCTTTTGLAAGPGLDIGYAWMREQRRGLLSVGHDGLTIGYASRFRMLPDADLGYAVLTNSVKGKPLAREIERLILDEMLGPVQPIVPPAFDPDAFAHLEGLYDCGFYGQVRLRVRNPRMLQ